jgi:hypothetical protein
VSDHAPSFGELAVSLIVGRCIPAIGGGSPSERVAVNPLPLSEDERDRLGLKTPSATFIYPVGESGVVLDLTPSMATVMFRSGDCTAANAILERELLKRFPSMQQRSDGPHPVEGGMRARIYQLDLSGGRRAVVETAYPEAGASGGALRFVCRVHALQVQS